MKVIKTNWSKTIHAYGSTEQKHVIAKCGWYQKQTLYKNADDSYISFSGQPNCKKCLKLLSKEEHND